MTALQQRVYQEFIRSAAARRMLQAAESGTTAGSARVLSAITALKKLCNHPKLIYDAIYNNTGNAADGFEVHGGPRHLIPAKSHLPGAQLRRDTRSGSGIRRSRKIISSQVHASRLLAGCTGL